MDEPKDSVEFANLRGKVFSCLQAGAFAAGVDAAKAALELVPNEPYISFGLSLNLIELQQRSQAIDVLRHATRIGPNVILPAAMRMYLQNRRRTAFGASFEDGWIAMLEVVLAAGLVPTFTFDSLTARAEEGASWAVNSKIPLSIVQFWDAQTPPTEVVELAQRTQEANPDCSYQMFCEDSAREFLRDTLGARATELFDACPHAAAKSDFFRVAYLFDRGGIYIDADEAAVRPLSHYIQRNGFDLVLRYTKADVSCIDNCFIAVRPRMLLLQRVLDAILGNLTNMARNGMPTNVWVLTGPGVWTFSLVDLCLDPLANYRGSPLARTCLLEGADYQRLFDSPVMEYKSTEKGNWRLLKI